MNGFDPIHVLIGLLAALLPYSQAVLHISNPGSKKINLIKLIREITSLGLKEAKDISEGKPVVITSDQMHALVWRMEETSPGVAYYRQYGSDGEATTVEPSIPLDLARRILPEGNALVQIRGDAANSAEFLQVFLSLTYEDAAKYANGEIFMVSEDQLRVLRLALSLGSINVEVLALNASIPF